MVNGIDTTNVETVTLSDDVMVNKDGSTARQKTTDLATQLAGSGALAEQITPLKDRASALEATASDQGSRLTAVEGEISAEFPPLKSRATALEASSTGQETRLSVLENGTYAEAIPYATSAAGIADTVEGQRFKVDNADPDVAYDVYLHDAGDVAVFVESQPSVAALVQKVSVAEYRKTFPDVAVVSAVEIIDSEGFVGVTIDATGNITAAGNINAADISSENINVDHAAAETVQTTALVADDIRADNAAVLALQADEIVADAATVAAVARAHSLVDEEGFIGQMLTCDGQTFDHTDYSPKQRISLFQGMASSRKDSTRPVTRAENRISLGVTYSVTFQGVVAGDATDRDLVGISYYYYPDPEDPEAPWIRDDGNGNNDNIVDLASMSDMGRDLIDLGTAYRLTKQEKYREFAHDLLRIFYMDPTTGMLPRAQYSSFVPNKNPTGFGVAGMESVFERVLGSIQLLDTDLINPWLEDYRAWMLTDADALDERNSINNHSLKYYTQLAMIEQQLGRNAALTLSELFNEKWLGMVDLSTGEMPHESVRADAWHYYAYTLHSALLAYNMAVIEGVDLSKVTASFQLCLDYLIPVIKGVVTWPHTGYGDDNWDDFYEVFLLADTHFDTDDTAAYILTNYGEHFDEANSDLLYKK